MSQIWISLEKSLYEAIMSSLVHSVWWPRNGAEKQTDGAISSSVYCQIWEVPGSINVQNLERYPYMKLSRPL